MESSYFTGYLADTSARLIGDDTLLNMLLACSSITYKPQTCYTYVAMYAASDICVVNHVCVQAQ